MHETTWHAVIEKLQISGIAESIPGLYDLSFHDFSNETIKLYAGSDFCEELFLNFKQNVLSCWNIVAPENCIAQDIKIVLHEYDNSVLDDHIVKKRIVDFDLNPEFKFENFIEGEANKFAAACAREVVRGVYDEVCNIKVLLLHGESGVGKTHLSHAIAHAAMEKQSDLLVKYITAENFMRQFSEAMKNKEIEQFRSRFRGLDLLIVDDIHTMHGQWHKTQKELLHTFTDLMHRNSVAVIVSMHNPDNLSILDTLKTKVLSSAVRANISQADYDLRREITYSKFARYNDCDIKEDVINYLVTRFKNIRALEAAIQKTMIISRMKKNINFMDIKEYLDEDLSYNEAAQISLDTVVEVVATFYNVQRDDILSSLRRKDVNNARNVAMYFSRVLTQDPLEEIGRFFGGRKHSSVIRAYKLVENKRDQDNIYGKEISRMHNMLKR